MALNSIESSDFDFKDIFPKFLYDEITWSANKESVRALESSKIHPDKLNAVKSAIEKSWKDIVDSAAIRGVEISRDINVFIANDTLFLTKPSLENLKKFKQALKKDVNSLSYHDDANPLKNIADLFIRFYEIGSQAYHSGRSLDNLVTNEESKPLKGLHGLKDTAKDLTPIGEIDFDEVMPVARGIKTAYALINSTIKTIQLNSDAKNTTKKEAMDAWYTTIQTSISTALSADGISPDAVGPLKAISLMLSIINNEQLYYDKQLKIRAKKRQLNDELLFEKIKLRKEAETRLKQIDCSDEDNETKMALRFEVVEKHQSAINELTKNINKLGANIEVIKNKRNAERVFEFHKMVLFFISLGIEPTSNVISLVSAAQMITMPFLEKYFNRVAREIHGFQPNQELMISDNELLKQEPKDLKYKTNIILQLEERVVRLRNFKSHKQNMKYRNELFALINSISKFNLELPYDVSKELPVYCTKNSLVMLCQQYLENVSLIYEFFVEFNRVYSDKAPPIIINFKVLIEQLEQQFEMLDKRLENFHCRNFEDDKSRLKMQNIHELIRQERSKISNAINLKSNYTRDISQHIDNVLSKLKQDIKNINMVESCVNDKPVPQTIDNVSQIIAALENDIDYLMQQIDLQKLLLSQEKANIEEQRNALASIIKEVDLELILTFVEEDIYWIQKLKKIDDERDRLFFESRQALVQELKLETLKTKLKALETEKSSRLSPLAPGLDSYSPTNMVCVVPSRASSKRLRLKEVSEPLIGSQASIVIVMPTTSLDLTHIRAKKFYGTSKNMLVGLKRELNSIKLLQQHIYNEYSNTGKILTIGNLDALVESYNQQLSIISKIKADDLISYKIDLIRILKNPVSIPSKNLPDTLVNIVPCLDLPKVTKRDSTESYKIMPTISLCEINKKLLASGEDKITNAFLKRVCEELQWIKKFNRLNPGKVKNRVEVMNYYQGLVKFALKDRVYETYHQTVKSKVKEIESIVKALNLVDKSPVFFKPSVSISETLIYNENTQNKVSPRASS